MYLLGFDIGSSSVKASLIDAATGICLASAFFPEREMEITAPKDGWAEQQPEMWWTNLKAAVMAVLKLSRVNIAEIKGIGISYQMHGLVCVDKNHEILRPSIIWCDSRAVEIGANAFAQIGPEKCLSHLLNSPGNFTASKLKWVKNNEPAIFEKIHKIMLPGDYIAMRLTGEINTTLSGLSEAMLWDFKNSEIANFLLQHYGIAENLLPNIVPAFSLQGSISKKAANELGLAAGTPVCYRAGDQPNNAFSLNVLEPGEIAATAGTSGVVYGISNKVNYDPLSRINTFAHVNHKLNNTRLGILLCINGTGILNSWIKNNFAQNLSYNQMNQMAANIAIGSNGLLVYPFGNGAERMLNNQNQGAKMAGLNFNIHSQAHVFRAAQEGIVFAFHYGMNIMKQIGIHPRVIRAGHANMFLSPIFRNTLASLTGAVIELYNTNGALGAARAAGIGAGIYKNFSEAFNGFEKLESIEPSKNLHEQYFEAYENWKSGL